MQANMRGKKSWKICAREKKANFEFTISRRVLRAKSLLGISVFIHIEIRTNYHDGHFAFTLALIETGENWDMVDYIAMQIKDCLPTSRKDR